VLFAPFGRSQARADSIADPLRSTD